MQHAVHNGMLYVYVYCRIKLYQRRMKEKNIYITNIVTSKTETPLMQQKQQGSFFISDYQHNKK